MDFYPFSEPLSKLITSTCHQRLESSLSEITHKPLKTYKLVYYLYILCV